MVSGIRILRICLNGGETIPQTVEEVEEEEEGDLEVEEIFHGAVVVK